MTTAAVTDVAHSESPPDLPAASRTSQLPSAAVLALAAGLFAVTLAYTSSRMSWSEASEGSWRQLLHGAERWLYWGGIVAMSAGPLATLVRRSLTRTQVFVLVSLSGLAFYLTKVAYEPFGFTFADELVHQHNATAVALTGELFVDNSILPVTSSFPGLGSVTAMLSSITGMSVVTCGMVVIGLARLVLTCALLLLVERTTGSTRAGGLAALLYAAAPNYLYFLAQYAYESLALPLALVVLLAVDRARVATSPSEARRWTAVAIVVLPVVVVTHHMTSYALVVVLGVWTSITLVQRAGDHRREPLIVAPLAALAVAVWFAIRASSTLDYLRPVLRNAVRQTVRTITGDEVPRRLFSSPEAASVQSPLYERLMALASVVILVAGVVIGLRRVGTWRGKPPLVIIASITAAAFLLTFPLRLVPAAWESAQRASEFLFVGVAGLVAAAIVHLVRTSRPSIKVMLAAAATLTICGGIVGGWPYYLRLPSTFRVTTAGVDIEAQSVTVARASAEQLGTQNRVAAEAADARLFQALGEQVAFAGVAPAYESILHAGVLEDWAVELLQRERIDYVVVNHRTISSDAMAGYFFDAPGASEVTEYGADVIGKFDIQPGTDRVMDSGDIVIYDISGIQP